MKLILIGIMTCLCACEDNPSNKNNENVIVTESGKRGAAVGCWAGRVDCLKKVSKVCPNGYKILQEDVTSMVAECQ